MRTLSTEILENVGEMVVKTDGGIPYSDTYPVLSQIYRKCGYFPPSLKQLLHLNGKPPTLLLGGDGEVAESYDRIRISYAAVLSMIWAIKRRPLRTPPLHVS